MYYLQTNVSLWLCNEIPFIGHIAKNVTSSTLLSIVMHICSQNLSSTILLEHHGAPSGLDVTYRSHCTPAEGDNTPWQRKGECMNVKLNQQVWPKAGVEGKNKM